MSILRRKLPGRSNLLFLGLCFLNLTGLIPMVFPVTTQPEVLFVALVLFRCGLRITGRADGWAYLSHLVPKGRPLLLAPFLVLIESVSLIIRPFTLAVRILANLAVGHVVCGLLSLLILGYGANLTVLLGFFYLFEVAVAFIQAYIFRLLINIYLEIFTLSI